jgi:hypothetical protein
MIYEIHYTPGDVRNAPIFCYKVCEKTMKPISLNKTVIIDILEEIENLAEF